MGLMDGQKEAAPFTACCAMNFCLGHGSVYDEKWAPWIEPLLNEPLFKGVETLATEYAVCDKIKRIGGSFDFLLRTTDPNDKRVILGDLKTVSSKKGVSSRRPATAQLQAYRSFLATCITLRWW